MKADLLTIITAAATLLVATCSSHAASPQAERYRPQITRESQFRFGVPPPAPVIAGQIQQESGFNPLAKSPVGAQGLMQFMPATAQWANTTNAWGSVEPFNPVWSIRAGVWYDRWLYERVRTFDSECDRWQFAFSGYNGGLGYVYKRQKRSGEPGNYAVTSVINPGIQTANQRENQEYAPRIVFKHQPKFADWGRQVCR